jgi:nucleoside-diphosphate-sugar epimerase
MMVYGPTEPPEDEDSILEPVNAYGRSKILAEGIHRLWQSERSGHAAADDRAARRRLRAGRTRQFYPRLSQALKGCRFVYPGRTDTVKACGCIDDLISSMIQMEERNEGVFLYNFCRPDHYTSADIYTTFSTVAGYPTPRFVAPFWLIALIASGFEMLSVLRFKTDINRAQVRKLYQSTNMVPRRLQKVGFSYRYNLADGLAACKASSRVGHFD